MKHPRQAEAIAIINNFIVAFSHKLGFDNLAEGRRHFDVWLNALLLASPLV